MKKEMLINVLQPEECRIAILEDGVLEELYVERTSHESYVGNIYKGRIVNIEPSIQAAFVDFGVGRNGFLHVSDVEPAYYKHLEGGRSRDRDRNGRDRGRGRDRDRDRERDRARSPEPPPQEPDYFDDEPVEPLTDRTEAPPVSEEAVETAAPAEVTESAPEETATAAPVVEEAEALEAAAEAEAPPLVAHPDTLGEEDTGVKRRRRGGSRRKRAAPEPEAEATEEAKGEDEPAAPDEAPSEEPPKPRLMDSAEHRTSEEDESAANDDDLLFFTKPSKAAPPPAREPESEPEPEPEPEPVAEAPRLEEPEPVVEREPAEEPAYEEPPRRRREGRSRGSVEADLAADLAALDIGDDAPPGEFQTSFEASGEPAYEPTAESEPAEEIEGEFEASLPASREHREDRRRDDRRGGRDRDRDRGRGRDRDRGRGDRGGRDRGRMGGRPGMGRPKPLIQDIFKRGQEVIVQVIKEGIGTKGPTLSTYISIAGRYLVLMPGLNRVGVSRKIDDDEQRRRLREIFSELKPPRGLGFIIRTAGMDKNKKELQRDLAYLSRLYLVIAKRIQKLKAPCEIYQESDMVTRTLRDTFASDVDTIWVDEPGAYEHAKEFMTIVMPRYASRLKLYDGKEPLFHKYGIEDEITRIQQRKIPLPHGGSIVIEQTEALVSIDVNSGNFRANDNNAEETAYQMNLHAAKEIARQLRLRDMGGQVVVDFIDMRDEKHRRAVEKALREAMKRDRARTKILKISQFGMVEMTRQRIRPSLKRSVYMDCPYCHGMAQVKTNESMSIEVMRMLQLAAHLDNVQRIEITVTEDVANYLLNKKRREIAKLEESGNTAVTIGGRPGVPPETLEFVCYDKNNNEVKFPPTDEPPPRGRR
jgi:ribonuclease E